jgi:four helix bundle protein
MGIAEELRQRTLRYALRVIAFCRSLPDNWVARELGRQLLRAGMGVSGNYWSACRGRSHKEFVAKLGVSVDEAEESVLWLTASIRSGIRDGADAVALLNEGQEILAILAKSAKTARENRLRRKSRKQLTNSPIHELGNSSEGSP